MEKFLFAEQAVVAISSTMGEWVRSNKSASALTIPVLKLFQVR